jgi:hypothetical protein
MISREISDFVGPVSAPGVLRMFNKPLLTKGKA